jgi:hypothetical protein
VAANALILGCGRSGTSIFGELFASFPAFRYYSEPLLCDLVGILGRDPVAVKVPRQAEGASPRSGCSVELADVRSVLPGPLVVFWQVRHPLDAICSLRVGIEQDWDHHPRPLDWRDWQDRPLIERCAHHWAVINEDGYQQVRRSVIVNRFEDMIADPHGCGLRAAGAVGVEASQLGEAFGSWVGRVQDQNNDRFVEAETSRRNSRPDHSRRVGRWMENLTPAEVRSVLPIVSTGAERFGYELPVS